MDNKIKNALLLTWGEISFCVGERVSNIVGRKITCHTRFEDNSYWGVSAINDTFSVQELKNILCSVNASKLMCDEALPPDSDYSRSLGMSLSEKLLEKCIGTSWEHAKLCERIRKMQLKEGSYVNIIGKLDEDVWTDNTTKEEKRAMVIILDELEYASNGSGKSNNNQGANNHAAPAQNGSETPAADPTASDNFTGFEPMGDGNMFDVG